MNRFLFCHVSRARFLPRGGDYYRVAEDFGPKFAKAANNAKLLSELRLSDSAADLWDAEYERLEQQRDGRYGLATTRLSVHCLKVAMIYAAADRAERIDVPHMKAALAVVNYCNQSAAMLFGGRQAEPETDFTRAERLIREQPGITRTEVYNRLRLPSDQFSDVLEWLRRNGRCHPQTVKTGGRSGERWYPGVGQADGLQPPSPLALMEQQTTVCCEDEEVGRLNKEPDHSENNCCEDEEVLGGSGLQTSSSSQQVDCCTPASGGERGGCGQSLDDPQPEEYDFLAELRSCVKTE